MIHDHTGKGLLWANSQIYENREKVTGQYVYVLDDDDTLISNEFIFGLKQIHQEHKPDIIAFKGFIGGKLFPPDGFWGKNIAIRGTIGSCNFVVKNEIFQKYAKFWCQPRAGDYFFISQAMKNGSKIHWWNKVVFDAPIGGCRPESGN